MVNKQKSSYSKRLLHLISWGHWFTFFNIAAAIVIAVVFLDAEGMPETLLSKVYMATTWLGHMAFLTFVTFVLTVFPITLIYPKTRFIRGIASVIFTVLLTLLLLDGFTYHQLGYHLNWASSGQIISLVEKQYSDKALSFTGIALAAFIAILIFELVVSNYAWKHLKELQQKRYLKAIVGGLLLCFVASHVIHIYADAKVDYQVLKQDNMLPFSHPATAKTLLTKYGLFDQQDYRDRRNSPITLTQGVSPYPSLAPQCALLDPKPYSVFIVLNDSNLSKHQIDQFNKQSAIKGSKLINHIDNANQQDAWFNLLFSLPSLYASEMQKQDATPMLLQQLAASDTPASLTLINDSEQASTIPDWLLNKFAQHDEYRDISPFVFADRLNSLATGLHIFYFQETSDYQYELFVNALLLAQKQKTTQDVIWITSLGNKRETGVVSTKPSLVIWPDKQARTITELTANMDIATTLLRYWYECRTPYEQYGNGRNVYRIRDDRIFANTVENGLLVVKKDKNIIVDQQGNFESYSTQLDTLISEDSDMPMLIEGVNQINLFNQLNVQLNEEPAKK
ncbi:DUF3413 domain-containing protein [Thalassotalea ponticola]|uniref:DUF3413 domain-containing protein n=1 Tax=Thalassotalea ponticola TaxID=1523392 RepID=UPI0025B2BC48|nr:DUF3413 domain-containing protein [Thalassotalea ponticola]MDN3651502.1 DUF3413 domain-containing protein [Thalassotalea ponticola]